MYIGPTTHLRANLPASRLALSRRPLLQGGRGVLTVAPIAKLRCNSTWG